MHAQAKDSVRALFRGTNNWIVNVGCGTNPAPGWVNLDLIDHPGVYSWNCAEGLPFDDASVVMIFGEHVYEHFEVPGETRSFLRECLRCLKKGGILRLVVPDAGKYVGLYHGTLADYEPIRPLKKVSGQYLDFWLNRPYETKMELINAVFRQDGQHKYAYDAETLCRHLEKEGFERVVHQEFGESLGGIELIDNPHRRSESLYVEAVK